MNEEINQAALGIAINAAADIDRECDDVAVEIILRAVNEAMKVERERCIKIMYAEREWGSDLVEACERIEKGLQPRIIPGWNAPSED